MKEGVNRSELRQGRPLGQAGQTVVGTAPALVLVGSSLSSDSPFPSQMGSIIVPSSYSKPLSTAASEIQHRQHLGMSIPDVHQQVEG